MKNIEIVDITKDNLLEYNPTCFLKADNIGCQTKLKWIKQNLSKGLRIKLLFTEKGKKYNGYIEYIDGENAWRAVNAKGYLLIQCIWMNPNKVKKKGYASLLIKEVLKEAEERGKYGVAVLTSEGPFMAGKALFLKNGFKSVDKAEPSFELMVKNIKKSPSPKIKKPKELPAKYKKGLHILYTNQCPWVIRFIKELDDFRQKQGIKIKPNIVELKSPKEAQGAPSIYASFNLIYNGNIIADHYISLGRFLNIVKKELK